MLLASAETVTTEIHEGSRTLFEEAQKYMPGGNSRHSVYFRPYPVYARSGERCYVTDEDGVRRMDCINNMSALIHGHGFAPVVDAVTRQCNTLLSAGMPTALEVDLAKLVTERVESVERIRFCTSGSEAIMIALRAARAITGRSKIAKAEGAYHGSYDAVEYSLLPDLEAAGPATAPHAVPATPGLSRDTAANTLVFPYNDIAATVAIIESNARDLAAVVIDPCVSRMGFIMGDSDYLQAVREACTRCGVVLIYDEIFSFRLHNRGAQAIAGVKPDLTTFGKVIGGGMPIGAVGGSESCMGVFDQLRAPSVVEHSGTHFANPLSLAAGHAAMQALDQACTDHLEQLGEQLRDGINESFARHGLKGHAAGSGSLMCAMLSEQPLANYRDFMRAMQEGAAAFGMLLHRAILTRGAHIVPGGGFILSSVMQASDISALLEMIDDAMPEVKQALAGV